MDHNRLEQKQCGEIYWSQSAEKKTLREKQSIEKKAQSKKQKAKSKKKKETEEKS